MSFIGNVFWFLLGGMPLALLWMLAGIFWFLTIIGIPIARQCFKLASLQFAPFGKQIVDENRSGVSLIANVFWLIFGGIELALANLAVGIVYAMTIIGLPFARQSLKLARLSLMPFGKRVEKKSRG